MVHNDYQIETYQDGREALDYIRYKENGVTLNFLCYYPGYRGDGYIELIVKSSIFDSKEHRERIKHRIIEWASKNVDTQFIASQLTLESTGKIYLKFIKLWDSDLRVYILEGEKIHVFLGYNYKEDNGQKFLKVPDNEAWMADMPSWLKNRRDEVIELILTWARKHPEIGKLEFKLQIKQNRDQNSGLKNNLLAKEQPEVVDLDIKPKKNLNRDPDLGLKNILFMIAINDVCISGKAPNLKEIQSVANTQYKQIQKNRNAVKMYNLFLFGCVSFIIINLLRLLYS